LDSSVILRLDGHFRATLLWSTTRANHGKLRYFLLLMCSFVRSFVFVWVVVCGLALPRLLRRRRLLLSSSRRLAHPEQHSVPR
jgi:hypothetical protein